jgi:hypothetical protein
MRLLLVALLLLATPALAQLQFDSTPKPATSPAPNPVLDGSGIAWLQRTPMTLFDLGMMELTDTANKLGIAADGIQGAVAEYQEEKKLIVIGFYSALSFNAPDCIELAQRLREALFLQRRDPEKLAREVGAYFISYGPIDPNRPRNIGRELMEIIRITIYQQGGLCQLPLTNDNAEIWEDPNAAKPANAEQKKEGSKTAAPAKP